MNDQAPGEVRKEEKRANEVNHFEEVAFQWWARNKETWPPDHATRVLKQLEKWFPNFQKRAVTKLPVG